MSDRVKQGPSLTRADIVDTAIELADEGGWESVRLFDIADRLQIELDQLRQFFREKEDIVDAWFDRADQAMLRVAEKSKQRQLSTPDRLHEIIMAWFEFLQPHRRCSREMILNKLEPGHLHYQWAGILRVSRTVQWIREAARRPQTLPWRALEEAALTSIYLASVAVWMVDDSHSLQMTSSFLRGRLRTAGRVSACFRSVAPSVWPASQHTCII